MKKKCKVIMLPTEKESDIWSNKGRRLYYNQTNLNDPDEEIRYHLYLVSDEKINDNMSSEKGWGYNIETKEIIYCDENFYNPWVYKIIATTNKSLDLPQIPQSFIESYVKANGEIDEVEVDGYINIEPFKLFITEFNEVIISLKEEKMYSKEEVEELIYKATLIDSDEFHFDKWIKENL